MAPTLIALTLAGAPQADRPAARCAIPLVNVLPRGAVRRPAPMPRIRGKQPGPVPMPNIVPAPSCKEEEGGGVVTFRLPQPPRAAPQPRKPSPGPG